MNSQKQAVIDFIESMTPEQHKALEDALGRTFTVQEMKEYLESKLPKEFLMEDPVFNVSDKLYDQSQKDMRPMDYLKKRNQSKIRFQ